MFGYITPLKDELKMHEYTTFKSYYCGLCFHLKKEFGNLPRMVLNYDMTFLAILLDSLNPTAVNTLTKKCLTSPFKKKPVVLENKALSYAANINISLVYYKLLDDVLDDKSLKSKTLALALAPYKKKFSPSVCEINLIIEENLNHLYKLEKEKNFSSIDEICDPFSLIVAHIFKMYPCTVSEDSNETRENLFKFGYALGKWIYMIDALDDLQKDIAHGKFNPLDFLYNKAHLTYLELLPQIKDTVSFTILNCGYNCKYYLDLLPVNKNKELLENIITLGMMDQYTKVIHACNCKEK
ncbi:DUF5685 family protein [Cellulosilyticum sp. I15G10I2]|uniref:DUF5685 family protein n=1 Tax=Cellulosilyticum sp. I15G10I2 TaxID=1892843 RepID=UPI00085BE5E3|nr:DUF5685 family protein [Cellulosilyticum sp. I15G10I2]